MNIIIGKQYRNKKHGTLYHVLGFTRQSETMEIMVTYERVDPNMRDEFPWSRPIDLFKDKFEDIGEKKHDVPVEIQLK